MIGSILITGRTRFYRAYSLGVEALEAEYRLSAMYLLDT